MDYTKKLLEVRDLHKAYSKEGVPTKALNGITFDVLSGEYLGIMGASGSGKTTLLNCIATVIKPTSGQILLSGANISAFDGAKLAEYRGNRIGYLFQDFALLDNLTGRENILLPLSIHNIDSSIAEKHLNDIAGFLGIIDVLSKFPAQMSGGQKQRVAAARSLISNPDIILADEPTGALDTKAARLLMEKLQEVNQVQGRTILMVTHDLNQESSLMEIVKLIGGDVLPDDQKLILEIAKVIRLGFLQQNAFHKDDTCVSLEKQFKMMDVILYLYKTSRKLVAMGMPMSVLKAEGIFEKVIAIKYDVPNDNLQLLDLYKLDIDDFYNRVIEKNA